jgi:hypothetical protein
VLTPRTETPSAGRIGSKNRGRRWRLGVLLLLVAATVVEFRRPLFCGNFGEVAAGRAYRSAQPTSNLEGTIERLHLGSIMNLRGGSDGDAFYRAEAEAADRRSVEFFDLPLSATRRPTRRELMLTVAALERCRYPVLIHCKWGSDRTGLVSALYRMVINGEPPEAAIGEFSLAHGHFPFFGPEHLHEPIDEYARWLRDRGLSHDPGRFRSWIERDYRADDQFSEWPDIRPGRRPRRTASTATSNPY